MRVSVKAFVETKLISFPITEIDILEKYEYIRRKIEDLNGVNLIALAIHNNEQEKLKSVHVKEYLTDSSIVYWGYQGNFKPVYFILFFFSGKGFVCTKIHHKQKSANKTKIS